MTDRPRVVLLVGLPGSGKSTWARAQGAVCLSTDELRHLLSDDETNQTIHAEVFATLRYLLRKRLHLRRPVTFIDATNITIRERRSYIRIAQMHGACPEAIFFDTPIEVCRERNRNRKRVVPESAIDMMATRLQPPAIEEGLESVTVYRLARTPGEY